MARLVLVPHNMGSNAARDLANKLTEKVGHKVWRCSPDRVGRRIPFALKGGTDKLTQMQRFKDAGVSIPDFTTDHSVAVGWLADGVVVCRTLLRSSEGAGIIVAENAEQLVAAPLYTKYFKKKREYRVHVFNGQVIDVQEKRRRSGVEGGDTRIRNLANGYVFCRDGLVEPDGLRELAIKAVQALGYTLGAVDVAYNAHHNSLVVFEVNANPGLQGTTLENYANAIVGWYKEQE
jgi:glutathione synthase/RimK-type ligase-like ATP-grasp enzyme